MDIQSQISRLQMAADGASKQFEALSAKTVPTRVMAQVLSIPVAVPVPSFQVRRNSVVCGEDFIATRLAYTVEMFDGTGTLICIPDAVGFYAHPTTWNPLVMFDFKWNLVQERTQQHLGVAGNLSRRWLGACNRGRDLPLAFPRRFKYGERVAFVVEPVLFPAVSPGVAFTPTTMTVSLNLLGYRQRV